MKSLIWIALVAGGCLTDPPYRPYAPHQQTTYGPPPGQQASGPYADPNSPTGYSNYPTYQTNLNGAPAPTGPQPPPFVPPAAPPAAQGGVGVTPTVSPPLGPPPAPPVGAPPSQPPVQASGLPPSAAGRYQCWVAGAGMYAQSSLGLITLDFNNSYTASANPAPGTYVVDGTRVRFTGGSLAGYIGALESNVNGPLLRLRTELPNDPGVSLRIGDHVCYLMR